MERNNERRKIPYGEMTPEQQYDRLTDAWVRALGLSLKTNSSIDSAREDRLRELMYSHSYRPIWEAKVEEKRKDPNSFDSKLRAFMDAPEGSEKDRAFYKLYADPLLGLMAAVSTYGTDAPIQQIEEAVKNWGNTFNQAADEIQ